MRAFIYLMLLLLAGSMSQALAKTPGEVEVGGRLRDAKMQGLAGPSAKLSEFSGKPMIINVWASWCANRLPLTLLVNAQGQVLLKIYGAREWDDDQALALIGKTFHIKM